MLLRLNSFFAHNQKVSHFNSSFCVYNLKVAYDLGDIFILVLWGHYHFGATSTAVNHEIQHAAAVFKDSLLKSLYLSSLIGMCFVIGLYFQGQRYLIKSPR